MVRRGRLRPRPWGSISSSSFLSLGTCDEQTFLLTGARKGFWKEKASGPLRGGSSPLSPLLPGQANQTFLSMYSVLRSPVSGG